MHAERDHEWAGVLQGGLIQIADQAAHVPQGKPWRKRTHRHQAELAGFRFEGVAEADTALPDLEAESRGLLTWSRNSRPVS
jgi:hypothetical protein